MKDLEKLNTLVSEYVTAGPRREHLLSFIETIGEKLEQAPASSKVSFHHAYDGGLLLHIVETFHIAKDMVTPVSESLNDTFSIGEDEYHTSACVDAESLLIVSILHDCHKACDALGSPQYEPNMLKSGSQSTAIPYKVNKECFSFTFPYDGPDSHVSSLSWLLENNKMKISNGGVKSLALIAGLSPVLFSLLTPYEKDAIEFHGGAYETSKYELSGTENPLTIIFHCADMLSSRHGKTTKK